MQHNIKHISRWLMLAAMTMLTACADFDDATQPVSVEVQVVRPESFSAETSLEGKTVTMTVGTQTISQTTDASGLATFTGIVPDVYSLSTSWTLTADEYRAATGTTGVVRSATVSGALAQQMITGGERLSLATNVSVDRDLVIGKVYYASSKDKNKKSYLAGKYIELFNQSDDSIDVSGLYIGLTETESTPAYTLEKISSEFADSVVLLKQVYRIPATEPYWVKPGGTVVICNSAIDHTTNDTLESNLSDADFEVKDVKGRYVNNPNVKAMEVIYNIYTGTSIMNLLQSGPVGVVIFRTDADPTQWTKVYPYGKKSGKQFLLCPVSLVIDGMEALKYKTQGIDVKTKRLVPAIDAGYTNITATSGWNGQVVYRKTQSAAGSHRILVDTNNSSNDFEVSSKIKPREYE